MEGRFPRRIAKRPHRSYCCPARLLAFMQSVGFAFWCARCFVVRSRSCVPTFPSLASVRLDTESGTLAISVMMPSLANVGLLRSCPSRERPDRPGGPTHPLGTQHLSPTGRVFHIFSSRSFWQVCGGPGGCLFVVVGRSGWCFFKHAGAVLLDVPPVGDSFGPGSCLEGAMTWICTKVSEYPASCC
jgi:hypothetical protein